MLILSHHVCPPSTSSIENARKRRTMYPTTRPEPTKPGIDIIKAVYLAALRAAVHVFAIFTAYLPVSTQAFNLPPQGVYDMIELSGNWEPRLDQIAAGGFKVVLNYSVIAPWGSNADVTKLQLLAYADYANKKSLKIIWSIKDRQWWDGTNLISQFPTLASQLSATDSTDFIIKVVTLLKDHPATWGWYVADDDKNIISQKIISVANIVRAADPDPDHKLLQVESSNDWRAGIMQSLEPASDYVGFEHYPIGQFSTSVEQYANTQKRMDEVLEWTKSKDKPLVLVLQANDVGSCYPSSSQWYPYGRWPEASEIVALRNQMLTSAEAKGVSVPLILWYSYFDVMRVNSSAWNTLIQGAFAPTP